MSQVSIGSDGVNDLAVLMRLFGPPPLLSHEKFEHFEEMMNKFIACMRPEDFVVFKCAPGELDLRYAAFWRPIEDRDDCAAFVAALPDLTRVAHYERRAWSRRRRAFCEFLAIKLRRDEPERSEHLPGSVNRESDANTG